MKINLRACGAALAACLPLLVAAQIAKTDAPMVVPQLTYRSAFADYKPYKDTPLANWREVNDIVAGTMADASGHEGHSMVMKDMDGTHRAPAPPAAASAPMPMKSPTRMRMHDGQHKQGGRP
jgi:hypothetical protein